ncbi:hypothetical protein SynNOUM97013_01775 [Synechococcus sp. NOUM97013]|nr:hypothetical protein SynNOUM97013_01775 [Synechococcus sp. NOUM97013]
MEVWGDTISAVTSQPCDQSPMHFCTDGCWLADHFTIG